MFPAALFLLWIISSLLVIATTANTVTVLVRNDEDSFQNTTLCTTLANTKCNFRSAWYTCATIYNNQSCLISLPTSAEIAMNGTLGSLSLHSPAFISIVGNNASFSPTMNTLWTQSLFYISLQTKPGSISFENMTFSGFGSTDLTGGLINIYGNFNLTLSHTTITDITSNYGAISAEGTSVDTILTISSCNFKSNIASVGGALYLLFSVEVYISYTSFIDHNAQHGWGGAILAYDLENSFTMEHSYFELCRSDGGGGCIYLGRDADFVNVAFTVTDTVFKQPPITYSEYNGGALFLDLPLNSVIARCSFSGFGGSYSSLYVNTGKNLLVYDVTFTDCSASQGGGAVFYSSVNLVLSNTAFKRCTSQQFSGSAVAFANVVNVTLQSSTIDETTSPVGAAVFLYNVSKARLRDNVITNVEGGAVSIVSLSHNVQIYNLTAINCSVSNNGGAVTILNSRDVTIDMSTMVGNSAALFGGAVYLQSDVVDVRILRSELRDNHALDASSGKGGAIYISADCANVVIAGCLIAKNTAPANGGGVYVEQNVEAFAVLDYESYQGFTIVQSQHPYFSQYPPIGNTPYVIMNQTVSLVGAAGFVVAFSSHSNIFVTDNLYIYIVDPASGGLTQAYSSQTDGFPGVNGPPLFIPGESILFYFVGPPDFSSALLPAFGFVAGVYPVMKHALYPTVFRENSAGQKGGGMLLYFEINNVVLANVQFVRNQAVQGDGGGLSVQLANVGLSLWQVLFDGNVAKNNGGSLVVTNGNFAMTLFNCSFVNGVAGARGGAIYLVSGNGAGVYFSQTQNMINVSSSLFAHNQATSVGGGAIFADTSNVVQLFGCVLTENAVHDGNGGALLVNQYNAVSLVGCVLSRNEASLIGGALYVAEQSSAAMQDNVFDHNVAQVAGGAFASVRSLGMTFCGTNTFEGNEVEDGGGGALFLSMTDFWSAGSDDDACDWSSLVSPSTGGPLIVLRGNVATRGSAVLLYKVSFPSDDDNDNDNAGFAETEVQMTQNVAKVGGTVFWINDGSVMVASPPGLLALADFNASDLLSSFARDNVAAYGNLSGTQAMHIFAPAAYTVTQYHSYVSPAIAVTVSDFYNQSMPINGSSLSVFASIVDSDDSGPRNCSGNYPYLTGADTAGDGVAFVNGVALFDALSVFCAPHGNVSLRFSTQDGQLALSLGSSSSSIANYDIATVTAVGFRSCVAGEYQQAAQCDVCPTGSYNLATVDASACTKCIDVSGVSTCFGSSIVVRGGFWRRFATSSVVLRCTMTGNCAGGNATGDASCALGYAGPLCGVCTDGFFLSENACRPCNGDGGSSSSSSSSLPSNVLAALLLVVCILVLGACCAFYRYVYVPDDILETLVNENRSLSTPQLIYLWCKMKYHAFVVKFKIIAANVQIVTSTASTFKVTWPPSFAGFTYSMGVLNFNIGGLFSFGCSVQYDFFARLVSVTLLPLAAVAVMALAFVVQFSILRAQKRQQRKQQQAMREHDSSTRYRWKKGWDAQYDALKNQYLSYILYLTYFILPMVTTTIFQSFLCIDIDPDGENPGETSWYLAADLSISCETEFYYNWRIYAILMIFVYPIGIPALYFWLLYQQKDELMRRDDDDDDKDGDQDEDRTSSFSSSTTAEEESQFTHNPIRAKAGRTNNNNNNSKASEPNTEKNDNKNKNSNNKNNKKKRKESASSNVEDEDKQLSPAAERLSFLWLSYAPQYWYWEIVETTRRLLLTAALSVISPGSSAQNVLSILLALVYVKLYGYYHPYADESDDVLAEIGQFQVFFTFFTALVIQNQLLSPSYDILLGILLILLNLSIIVVSFKNEIEEYQEDMAMAKDEAQMLQQTQALVTAALRSRLSMRKKSMLEVSPLRHIRRQSDHQPATKAKNKNKNKKKAAEKGDSDDEDDYDDALDSNKDRQRSDDDATQRPSDFDWNAYMQEPQFRMQLPRQSSEKRVVVHLHQQFQDHQQQQQPAIARKHLLTARTTSGRFTAQTASASALGHGHGHEEDIEMAEVKRPDTSNTTNTTNTNTKPTNNNTATNTNTKTNTKTSTKTNTKTNAKSGGARPVASANSAAAFIAAAHSAPRTTQQQRHKPTPTDRTKIDSDSDDEEY